MSMLPSRRSRAFTLVELLVFRRSSVFGYKAVRDRMSELTGSRMARCRTAKSTVSS